MIKEFTGHVQVTIVSQMSNVISGDGTYDFMADPFDFQPAPSDEDGGMSYNCDKTFTIDTPSEEALRKFSIPRSCMVCLFGCNGTRYIIGTANIPARCLITRHLNRAQLQIHCKMLHNPLS